MATQETALRKRQQIAKANRTMFLWVAGASAIVGIALVLSLFLLQKAWFNEKVLAEKSKTASVLTDNNKVVSDLKDQIRVLNTNQSLKEVMIAGEDQPVQVVLDALPSDANSSALGSSLQEKFLNDGALKVESLTVDPVAGIESQSDTSVEDASTDAAEGENQITFRFTVSTDANNATALKNLLQRIERSIRPIDISTLTVETQGERLVLTASGRSFYEPARTVELKEKTVKP
jgi:head-tail adaptor